MHFAPIDAPPTGSDSPFGLAGPKSRKSDHQTYFHPKLAKINKFHMGMGNTGRVCLPRQGKVRVICFNKKTGVDL